MAAECLQPIKHPPLLRAIKRRIWDEVSLGIHGDEVKPHQVGGFEDILPSTTLGAGIMYNTIGSGAQLLMGLAVAPNPAIRQIVEATADSESQKLMHALRAQRVLSGFRMIDLGCGMAPTLAMTARSLGADMSTVDGEEPWSDYRELLANHSVMDMSAPGAPAVLTEETGGGFDYVTTNIIDCVPGHPQWKVPERATFHRFADLLLVDGGVYYKSDGPARDQDLLQKQIAPPICAGA